MFYLLTFVNGKTEALAGHPANVPARAMQLWKLGMIASVCWVGADGVPIPYSVKEAAA